MAKSLQGQTMRKATKLKRARKAGFRKRQESVGGKNVLKKRRRKNRKKLSVTNEFGSKMSKNKKIARRK